MTPYHAKYFAYELTKRNPSDSVQKLVTSLMDAQIDLNHQELDKEIKTCKTEAKKILNLEEKVKAQREIKEMEKKRNELRRNLFSAQDEVDNRKEKLIEEIELRMKQKVYLKELFNIRWRLE